MPSDFHEAIGWKAVAYLATSKLPPDRYMLAMREYERIMNNMRHSQLPEELLDLTEFYA